MLFKVLSLLVSSLALTYGLPVGQSSDDSVLSSVNLNFGDLATDLMTPPHDRTFLKSLSGGSISDESKAVHTSSLIEASKDTSVGAFLIPLETKAESAAVGGGLTAAAGVKGTAVGSAIATPIILKAVSLPALAAGATAAIGSVPELVIEKVRGFPQLAFHSLKTSAEDSTNNFANLLIVEDLKEAEPENDTTLDIKEGLNKGMESVAVKAGLIKAGALGMAAKGLVVAKNGARLAGRVILKPIAILTGVHLKMLGSGLALGGKLIGGTGAGIAKAGTVVKYTGLGSIGLGASAIAWGLDKTTIDTHFRESDRKFKL